MAKKKVGTSVTVKLFDFEGVDVRITDKNGNPWFVLADVCKVLDVGNPADVARRLDDDERGVVSIDTPGGAQKMTVISESGLYAVILTSRKTEAKQFRKWVTSTVLPEIRKTGSYTVGKDALREREREEGKVVRKEFTAILYNHGVRKRDEFRHMTNTIYMGLYNTDAPGLRERHGLPAKANVRNHMSQVGLAAVRLSEALTADRIVERNDYGVIACADSAKTCSSAVRGAIAEERRTRGIIKP